MSVLQECQRSAAAAAATAAEKRRVALGPADNGRQLFSGQVRLLTRRLAEQPFSECGSGCCQPDGVSLQASAASLLLFKCARLRLYVCVFSVASFVLSVSSFTTRLSRVLHRCMHFSLSLSLCLVFQSVLALFEIRRCIVVSYGRSVKRDRTASREDGSH